MKNLLILPVVAIMFVMFSFRPETGLPKNDYQEQLLSITSQSEILRFINMNISYPQEARVSSDTGRVFVVIKMEKGGTIKESAAFTEKNGITIPFLEEVVIMGNGPGSGQGATKINDIARGEHNALKAECLRVVNMLGSIAIPEWKDKSVEFAFIFNFQLKSNNIAVRPDPKNLLFIVDGLEKTYDEFSKINPKDIARVSIWRDSSSTSKYGVKGKNGVVEVISKK
jgi:hypothetical protein